MALLLATARPVPLAVAEEYADAVDVTAWCECFDFPASEFWPVDLLLAEWPVDFEGDLDSDFELDLAEEFFDVDELEDFEFEDFGDFEVGDDELCELVDDDEPPLEPCEVEAEAVGVESIEIPNHNTTATPVTTTDAPTTLASPRAIRANEGFTCDHSVEEEAARHPPTPPPRRTPQDGPTSEK